MDDIINKFGDQKACFASHMGAWLLEPGFMRSALAALQAGQYVANTPEQLKEKAATNTDLQIENEVAIIQIHGVMGKAAGKYVDTSTVQARRQIRAAVNDDNVSHILLHISSPGGSVAGNKELADEVAQAASKKPVVAQIEDLGASAAYWVASQATKVYINETGQVGSIGTMVVVDDSSEAYQRQGVKVHVISTGNLKGAFTAGTEITPEMLASLQDKVNGLNTFFLDAVGKGRMMEPEAVERVATGDTFLAARALELGLVDAVQDIETTFNQLVNENKSKQSRQRFGNVSNRLRALKAQSRLEALKQTNNIS